jgi:hypothetical protein
MVDAASFESFDPPFDAIRQKNGPFPCFQVPRLGSGSLTLSRSGRFGCVLSTPDVSDFTIHSVSRPWLLTRQTPGRPRASDSLHVLR